MAKKYSFDDHPQHRARLGEWRDKWITIALRTEPQTDADREACRLALRGLYRAAALTPPPRHREIFCASPISGAIAAVVASCVWWLREHPERHAELFRRSVTEQEMMAAIPVACRLAVQRGQGALRGEPVPATIDATDDATIAATYAATRDATDAATDDATYAATNAATIAATYAATRDATDAATDDATIAATDAATHAATDAATDDATDDATDAATDAATDDATDDATDAATIAATDAATDDATDDALVAFYLQAMTGWSRMRNGGNQWAGWCAYLSFFDRVARLCLPVHRKWRHYERAAAHGGPRFMHSRFWIVSDFPMTIGRDDRNRAHSATGPQVAWRDGWHAHSWRGTRVPGWWFEQRERLTPAYALGLANVELRRCAVEIIGWDKVLASLNARVIATDPDPEIGELIAVDLPDAPDSRFVRARCGTGRTVYYATDRSVSTPLEAVARSYKVKPEQYRPEVRT